VVKTNTFIVKAIEESPRLRSVVY